MIETTLSFGWILDNFSRRFRASSSAGFFRYPDILPFYARPKIIRRFLVIFTHCCKKLTWYFWSGIKSQNIRGLIFQKIQQMRRPLDKFWRILVDFRPVSVFCYHFSFYIFFSHFSKKIFVKLIAMNTIHE